MLYDIIFSFGEKIKKQKKRSDNKIYYQSIKRVFDEYVKSVILSRIIYEVFSNRLGSITKL